MGSSRGTGDLEEQAIGYLQTGAGLAAQLAAVVREAYRRGSEDASAELADAFSMHQANGDLDSFRDELAGRVPDDWTAPGN